MSLSYAQSLRAIGQSLESLDSVTMDLEKRDENYVLHVTANRKESDPSQHLVPHERVAF